MGTLAIQAKLQIKQTLCFFRPVDFLGSHSNRWTVVATYGATASAMLALLIGNGGIIVFESPWLKSE